MSASIGKTIFTKQSCFIVMVLKNRVMEMKNGENLTPSRTSDNVLFTKHNIVVFIINLHSKEEKLVVGKR